MSGSVFTTRRVSAMMKKASNEKFKPQQSLASALLVLMAALCSADAVAGDESAHALFLAGKTSEEAGAVGEAEAGPEFNNEPFPMMAQYPEGSPRPLLYAFASAQGKVQAFASVGGIGQFSARTRLYFKKSFRKGLASDLATFTISQTRLRLFVDPNGEPIRNIVPFADVNMTVNVLRPDPQAQSNSEEQAQPISLEIFNFHAKLQQNETTPFMSIERTRLLGAKSFDISGSSPAARIVPRDPTTNVEDGFYKTASFTGVIDLTSVPVGTIYTITYLINTEVQKHAENEGHAESYLADPLDVDSGFSITTNSIAVDELQAPSHCENLADRSRFIDNNDGTATDSYTALMWQRCPVGYALNTHGTAGELYDDTCDASAQVRKTWQGALQSASADTFAGRTDWRVPNVKEIDSLVEASCLVPAIDTLTFPATAPAPTWSATPDPRSGSSVKTVEFFSGTSPSLAKTATAELRLVRDSGLASVAPLPSILVGTPVPLAEGNAGTRTLIFPIVLETPAVTAVSVAYRTQDSSALAGEDYLSATGVAVIPAGQTRTEVSVTVLGDLLGEIDETLRLKLSDVSSNARLANTYAIGEIEDDDPVATIASNSVVEGNSGATSMSFTVTLSKAAATPVSIGYATADGTASAGVDYEAATGTLVIPAGDTSGVFTVNLLGDTLAENEENLNARLTSSTTNARLSPGQSQALGSIIDDDVLTLRALNDTGVVQCADTASSVKPCTQTAAFPGQDAQFGRDTTHNNNADGVAGFSFTKLDASGVALPNQSGVFATGSWDCVRDEVTGLQWEVKTDDGGLRDKDWTYSWFNSTGNNDGGNAGTANGGVCVDGSNCDTEKYVNAVNTVGMCGHSDWRMPTREELQSFIDVGDRSAPPYDADYFPNPPASLSLAHWTSTPDASDQDVAWVVVNLRGRATPSYAKSREFPVRLVRAGN